MLRTPKLDTFELSASMYDRTEQFSEVDFALLQMLMRYPDEELSREELKRCFDEAGVSDRRLDTAMRRVTQKMQAVWPYFPLVKLMLPDAYTYSEVPPKKKKPVSEA